MAFVGIPVAFLSSVAGLSSVLVVPVAAALSASLLLRAGWGSVRPRWVAVGTAASLVLLVLVSALFVLFCIGLAA